MKPTADRLAKASRDRHRQTPAKETPPNVWRMLAFARFRRPHRATAGRFHYGRREVERAPSLAAPPHALCRGMRIRGANLNAIVRWRPRNGIPDMELWMVDGCCNLWDVLLRLAAVLFA